MANVCFTSANVCNYTCTSPPPLLPPEPNFCMNTTTPTPTPTPTPTGNTTTTPTVTTTNGTAEPSTTGPGPNTGTTDLHSTVPSPITVELSSPADTNPTPEPGPGTSPTNLYTNTISPEGSSSNTESTTEISTTSTTLTPDGDGTTPFETTTTTATVTDLNTASLGTGTTTPGNGITTTKTTTTTQGTATATLPFDPTTSYMSSGSGSTNSEIITDIASSFGTTTNDDGTAPMVSAKTSLISDGTTLSNPTTLEPTANTISDGMTDVTKITSPSLELDDTTPLLTTQGLIENPTTPCDPNKTSCPDLLLSGPSAGLIAGCVCGAIVLLVLLAILIWWLWKKRKCCFAPVGEGSEAALRDNEEKQVELLKIAKKGTVILAPIEAPPAWPEQDGVLSTSPNPNTDKTPGELSKEEEALPSPTTGGKPDGATSKKKKKKKKGSRSNRVSPEPDQIPSPSTGENDG